MTYVAPGQKTGTVLVVDDSALSRRGLAAAVEALGHKAVQAKDGAQGLDLLENGGIDLVLLDMAMPTLSGFDVLEAMKERGVTEIPVFVVSSGDDVPDIVRAIQLGATDVLPKTIDPQLFRARIEACLRKKWQRDQELVYLADVQRLTETTKAIQQSQFDPDLPQLCAVAARDDALGDLAQMFRDMACVVHRREMAFRRQIDLLKGGFLLILIGLTWGAAPVLAKLTVAETTNPIGMAAWTALISTIMLTVILAAQRKLPRFTKNRVIFALVMGFIGSAAPQIILFAAAQNISALVLSIVMSTESLMVFALAAMLRIERPDGGRLLGLVFGLAGVLLVIVPEASGGATGAVIWVLVALLAPLCYGSMNIVILALNSDDATPMQMCFLTIVGALVWSTAAVLVTGKGIMPSDLNLPSMMGIASISFVSVTSIVLFIVAVQTTGAVFASQCAYFITFFGVVWGLLILGETPSQWIWYALICIVCGMVLVSPRDNAEILRDAT